MEKTKGRKKTSEKTDSKIPKKLYTEGLTSVLTRSLKIIKNKGLENEEFQKNFKIFSRQVLDIKNQPCIFAPR